MAGHRGYTFADFILISIVSAVWRGVVFCFAAAWRAYKRFLSMISGRPLEQCRSLYLTPALILGMVALVLILGALSGVSTEGQPARVVGSIVTGLSGAGILLATRIIIRRGCL